MRAAMRMPVSKPIVFVGPTLSTGEVEQILTAVCLPPAAQGAFIKAIHDHRPPVILLIDGVFQGEPAVRHKEILWAMAQGIQVVGAASMGALRAAELWRHGMIGVGVIYRWYRRFPLLADDAVAVLHAPAALDYRELTNSHVDLRMTIRAAQRRRLIDKCTGDRLRTAARSLGFRDRTLVNVVETAVSGPEPNCRRSELIEALVSCLAQQKKIDATAALHLVAKLAIRGEPRVQPTQFVKTTAFLRDLHHAGIELP